MKHYTPEHFLRWYYELADRIVNRLEKELYIKDAVALFSTWGSYITFRITEYNSIFYTDITVTFNFLDKHDEEFTYQKILEARNINYILKE